MKHEASILPAIILATAILFILIPQTAKAESFSISGIITAESYGAPQEAWVDVYDPNLNYIKRGQYDSITGGYYASLEQSNYYFFLGTSYSDIIPGFLKNPQNETITWVYLPDSTNTFQLYKNFQNKDITLAKGYLVTGTVKNSNGDPISGASVEFYTDAGSGFQKSQFEFITDFNGYFRAWALPSNQQLKIRARSNSDNYDSVWYGDVSSMENATILTVGSGQSLAITLPDKQAPQEESNPLQGGDISNGTTSNSSTNTGQTSLQNAQSNSDLTIETVRKNKYLITAYSASSVSKVYFYLDGKLKKIDKKAPFSCKFKIPKGTHVVKAIFYSPNMDVIKIEENIITR
jgi:hypothetical protein